jgi:prepilin-type N-terminal cleavage/methylation domain-containing protein
MASTPAGSASPRPVSSSSSEARRPRRAPRSAAGFSLVEVLVAMCVFTIGMLGMAQLLGVSVQMHQLGRNTDAATQLVQGKLEELMKMNFSTEPELQLTPAGVDSLATDVQNYFDIPAGGQFTRRWRVTAGPIPRTRLVTVRVEPTQQSRLMYRPVEIDTILREW